MKEPKLYLRKRDGIYAIRYYKDGHRTRKSLGTRDFIEARIKFAQLSGVDCSRAPYEFSKNTLVKTNPGKFSKWQLPSYFSG